MKRSALVMLIAGLVAGVCFAMAFDFSRPDARAQAGDVAAQPAPDLDLRALPGSESDVVLSYAPLVRDVAPAVVNVFAARQVRSRQVRDPFFDFFFGRGRMAPPPRTQQSLGSGVIVGADGLIVTNNHVVAGADEVLVALSDRRELPAEILFTDEALDLALLKVDPRGEALPIVPLGDSDQAEVGDIVVAIGNPFGVGQTVTQGIVSATSRTGVGISDYQFFLQTDAAINPGNSGGALIGMDGALVGINTAIYSRSGGSEGVGFAIPVNMVRQFLAGAETGRVARPWLGVAGQRVTRDLAPSLGLDRPGGVLVNRVTPGSPGERAGIEVGDVIVAVNGDAAADTGTLNYLTGSRPIGETVTLTVSRDGQRRQVPLRLVELPDEPPRDERKLAGQHILSGVTVANLNPRYAAELGSGLPERGVVVTGIGRGSPAARLRFLRPGDIIEAVNDEPVESARGLQRQMIGAIAEAAIRINRGGETGTCYFRAPRTFQCRG